MSLLKTLFWVACAGSGDAAAQDGLGNDLAFRFDRLAERRILVQHDVSAVAVVIIRIGAERAAQVARVQDDQMTEAFAADRAEQPLRMAVLPGRIRHGRPVSDSHRAQAATEDQAIGAVIIAHQMSRPLVPWKGLGELARQPQSGRMIGDLDMRDFAPSQREHDEGVKPAEAKRRHAEHVYRRDLAGISPEEGQPARRRSAARAAHAAGHARLGDAKAELQELEMNARRAPAEIFGAHPANETDELAIDPRPGTTARLAPPISAPCQRRAAGKPSPRRGIDHPQRRESHQPGRPRSADLSAGLPLRRSP